MTAGSRSARAHSAISRGWAGAWLTVRLLLGCGLLYFSVAQLDWAQLGANLAGAHPGWLGIAVASVLLSTAMKIVRWRWLIHLIGLRPGPGWLRLSAAFLIGQAANVVLPLRGGDLLRIGWLAVEDREDALPVTLTVLLEKYMDVVALSVLLLWLGPLLPLHALERSRHWLFPLGLGLSLVLAAAVGFAPLLWQRLGRWPALRGLVSAWPWLARLEGWIARIQGQGRLRSPQAWLPVALMTLATWVVMLATNLFVLRALDLPADFRAGGLVLALVVLGLAPALMPGNFGPFYFFAMLGLAPFGVPEPARAAFAVLLHAAVTLPPVLLAAGFLAAGRLRRKAAP